MELFAYILSSAVIVKVLDIWWDYKKNKTNPLNKAVCALLRDRILFLCEKYIEKGTITHKQFESLMSLYENYKALGGNGFIDEEVEMVTSLSRTK